MWPLKSTDGPGKLWRRTALELTRSFVRRMFVGKRILEDDQKIEEEIRRRYFGSSVKALLVAYRDARKRFGQIQERGQI